MEIATSVVFATITCCHKDCGVTFGVPVGWEASRRADHAFFTCINGHRQHFTEDALDKERQARLYAEASLEYWKSRSKENAAETERGRRAKRAIRGHLTRVKNRVGHGVCPCCRRTFKQLVAHMATKHPQYVPPAKKASPIHGRINGRSTA